MHSTTEAYPTLISALWPARNESAPWVRGAVLAIVGSALIALSAKIQVPFWPVPMTMQTFAVLVIGMTYGLRLGAATVALYLAEGAVGLPVFASGGGLAYFAGPTTGYLFGFLVAAALVGWLGERGWDRSAVRTLAANLAGTLVIFAFGLAWLTLFLASVKDLGTAVAVNAAVANGLTPFVWGALAKIALAAAVLPFAWTLVSRLRN